MIRILQVIDHLGSGGAQTALLNLVKYRDATRFDHTIASMHGRGAVADEFEALGLNVVSLSPSKWPPLYLFSLRRLLRSGHFDIVHFHLFGSNWLAKPLAYFLGCRVLFCHDQCNDAMRDHPLILALDRLTNKLSTRILAVSQSTVRFLQEKEGVPASRIEYFPNAADVAAFSPATPERRTQARARWNLPAGKTIIGGVGRLAAQKDFCTFLEAAAIVRSQQPQVHFVIFGEGPEEKALKEKANVLGLAACVTFAGYVADRGAIYDALDGLFLTSLYEGTPMVLLEAMVAGVPIGASAVDGTAEILSPGEAVLFPARDAAAAAAGLAALVTDIPLRNRLAEAARAKVLQHYNAVAQMRRLEELYEAALLSKQIASQPGES